MVSLRATKEEVIAAAKEANAYDFIMSLPNGFDTDIGQRGIKLVRWTKTEIINSKSIS